MQHRPGAREHRKSFPKGTPRTGKQVGSKKPKQVSQHHQLQLLHKSIKKAKQFELRKLIRRLKAVPPAAADTQVPHSKDDEATQKLQSQYDATKHLNTEVALQQAAAKCNLPASANAEQAPAQLADSTSDRLAQLACSRLLAATCVKQQMQAIKDLQTQMCQPEAAQQSTKQLPLSANVGMTKMAAEPSLDHRPAAISDVSQDASDHQEASQEDKQLAEDVIARLLASRATADEDEVSSAGDLSDGAQNSMEAHSMSDASMSSVDSQPGRDTEAKSMPTAPEAGVRTEHAKLPEFEKAKAREGSKAKLPVKEKGINKTKKKKNRLGQRARQQLGRVKQGQTMGFMQSSQQFKSNVAAAAAPAMRKAFKPASQSRSMPTQGASDLSAQQKPLHPSWAAKQKQKQALLTAAPAGRKTVFNESGQSVTASLPDAKVPSVKLAKPAGQGPAVNQKGTDKAEALHPSWAAKRAAAAQKVDFTSAPKAHKIVFED